MVLLSETLVDDDRLLVSPVLVDGRLWLLLLSTFAKELGKRSASTIAGKDKTVTATNTASIKMVVNLIMTQPSKTIADQKCVK